MRRDSSPTELTALGLVTITSLARWFCSLSTSSFTNFGSLHLDAEGQTVVGPFVRFFPPYDSFPFFTGPSASAKEMYLALIDEMIKQTLGGDRYPPHAELEGYLGLLETKSLVAECQELETERGYLKHGDDKGDHYMVDKNGELTGIIDWEW